MSASFANQQLMSSQPGRPISQGLQRQGSELDASACSACGGCGMLPGTKPDDDVMNTPCPRCNPWSKHLYATPPGDTLRETLKAKGISQTLLAQTMRRPIKTINEIIHAKARITEQTAIELEHALNIPAHFWMALETNYRIATARQNNPDHPTD